jgi:hypothetical protein
MPLVPSLQRKRKSEHSRAILEMMRVWGGGIVVVAMLLGLIALVTGNWEAVPHGLLWLLKYTVGLTPEH